MLCSRCQQVCDEVAVIPSKRLRNKIAGYMTVRCFPMPASWLSVLWLKPCRRSPRICVSDCST